MDILARIQPIAQLNTKEKPAYDRQLEGLRGLAAISVALHHIFSFKNSLDPAYHPANYLAYLQAGHSAVLLFFILSGYVIGLTNITNFSTQKVKTYLIRRGVRLIPIYFIAVSVGLWVHSPKEISTIIGNFLFLQNLDHYFSWMIPPIQGNPAVWSLNYEILYYLLFLILWCLRPSILLLFLLAITVSLLGWSNASFPQFIAGYASGWLFWLSGLWLAWRVKSDPERLQSFPLISYILLFYATHHLSLGKVILHGMNINESTSLSFVNLADLAVLPIGIVIVAKVTKRYFTGIRWIVLFSFAMPFSICLGLLLTGRLFENINWTISAIFVAVSLIFLNFESSESVLNYAAPLGSISYAFYLLHTPMIYLVHDRFFLQGTVWSFWLRLSIWFVITASVSAWLEFFLQPVLRRWAYLKLQVVKGT